MVNFIAGAAKTYIYINPQNAVLVGTPGVNEISLESLFTANRITFIKGQNGVSFNPKFPQYATLKKLITGESYVVQCKDSFNSEDFFPTANLAYDDNLARAIGNIRDLRPSNLQLISTRPSILNIVFQPPLGFVPQNYTVELSRDRSVWSNSQTVPIASAEYTALPGGNWFARVRANYTQNFSEWITSALPTNVTTPSPSNLTVSSNFPNAIQGGWTAPVNAVVANYTIAATLVTLDGTQNWINSQTVSTNSFSMGGLVPGTYIYRVRANITDGSPSPYVYSSEIQVLGSNEIPSVSQFRSKSPRTGTLSNRVELTWRLPTGISITNLTLERSDITGNANTWQATQTLPSNEIIYIYENLVKGEYLFRIRVNAAANSSAFITNLLPHRIYDTRVNQSSPKGGASLATASPLSWIEFDEAFGGTPTQNRLIANSTTLAVVYFNGAAIGLPFRYYHAPTNEFYTGSFTAQSSVNLTLVP